MTKENRDKYLKQRWNVSKAVCKFVCLLLVPCISYLLFEYLTGNLATVSVSMAVLNIAWMYVLYLMLFAVSGTTRAAVPVVSVFLLVLSLAEAFVVAFRDRPILLWDAMAFKTAMTVSGNYTFVITQEMKIACVCVILMNIALWFMPFRIRGWKLRLAAGAGTAAAIGGFAAWFFTSLVPGWGLGINMWAVNDTYKEYGYVLSTAVSLQYMVKKPPQGYSTAKLKEIHDRLEEEEQVRLASLGSVSLEDDSITPVNLICIMNESLSDLRTAGDFTTNTEYFPFISSLEENTVKGSLCVPVFGSLTSNSEFEFLTGDSMALLPSNSIAYQFNVKPDTYSMVSTLKDQGYDAVAMHPYPGENWNRVECYNNMGFDAFLDEEFYEDSEQLRNYVSDAADYDKLISVVESKRAPEDKLFIFNVTMQNHGGYEEEYDNFEQEVWLTGEYEGLYPKTDQYLSLMKKSDEAFQYLLEYFSKVDEPTMIVMFGDHQPSVEDEFFDAIAGMPSSEVPVQDHLMWYETPFIIWTNYDMPSRDMGKLGAVYLSSEVLRMANLELTPYNRFLLQMEEVLPVVHFLGCYDREGNYYYWAKAESERCPYQDMVLDYEALVYNHSLDRKKYKDMFVVK